MIRLGERLEVTPEAWGFGGEAILRTPEGGWLVISHGVPGERAVVEVVREPKRPGGAWRARVVEVVQASEERTDPACPHYSRCPGCQLRHVSYELELGLKRRSVRDALAKFGGLDPECVEEVRPAPSRDGYRVRGVGSAQTADGRPALAAFPGSGPPVPLDECPVMAPSALGTKGSGSQADPGWTLPNPAMRDLLTGTVRELMGLGRGERVVEVGAGRGALTVELAGQSGLWIGLDVDPGALEVGQARVQAAGLAGHVELRAGRLDKIARRLLVRHGGFDVALLNPMRRPLGRPAIAALADLGVRRCVYVGPSPTATARDLKHLSIPLRRVVPIDLYPGTYHVLTVALCEAVC